MLGTICAHWSKPSNPRGSIHDAGFHRANFVSRNSQPMKPTTRCRLKKNVRALLPFWAATVAWMIAPFLLGSRDPFEFALPGFLFGCAVLGPVCVGYEFQHRTMGALLAQPIPRAQVWREKLAVTGAAILSLSVVLLALLFISPGWDDLRYRAATKEPLQMAQYVAVFALVPIIGFCTGPTWTLLARTAIGGGTLSFLCPWALMLAGALLFLPTRSKTTAVEEQFFMNYALVVGGVYSCAMFALGFVRFQRLEDSGTSSPELAWPTQLSKAAEWFSARGKVGRRSALGSLVWKEFRLQQPTFVFAAFLVALWLIQAAAVLVGVIWVREILLLPPILLVLGIPISAGLTTADERSRGVHDWHLTLPVSAHCQWCVKVCMTFAVNALCGLLLPWLLGQGASALGVREQFFELPWWFTSLAIANGVVLCAALYSSTIAAGNLPAVIGTSILVAAVTLGFSPLSIYIFRLRDALFAPATPLKNLLLLIPQESYWLSSREICLTLGSGAVLLVLAGLCAAGFANFRRSLDSLRLPALRLVGIFCGALVIIFCMRLLEVAEGMALRDG